MPGSVNSQCSLHHRWVSFFLWNQNVRNHRRNARPPSIARVRICSVCSMTKAGKTWKLCMLQLAASGKVWLVRLCSGPAQATYLAKDDYRNFTLYMSTSMPRRKKLGTSNVC
eukprot:498269-Amphidinium_carterae.1